MSIMRKGLVALGAAALLALGVATPAQAGGSDSPTPYTVDSAGITLPTPDTFPDGGHVNLTTSQGGKGIHFESLNNQPSGQWIGQSFIPWSAFGLTDCDTVSWVQVSLYNEHYGEGGQESITVGNCGPPEEPEVIPNALYLSHAQICGSVDITLRNVSPWIYPTSVKIDGVHSYGPTVDNRTDGKLNGPQKDVSKTRTIAFAEDTGTHTVEYRIDAGSEKNLYKDTPLNEWVVLTVESDCEPNIPDQPEPLTGTEERTADAVCVAPKDGTAKIVTEERTWTQEYVLNGNAWVLSEKVYGDWAIVDQATVESDDCAAPVPPVTPEPPSEDRLATTGTDPTPYGLAGLAILVAGGAAIGGRKLALFKGGEG